MNEEEFIKEHPSLKGKGWIISSFEPIPIEGDNVKGEVEAYYEKPLKMELKPFEELSGLAEPPKLILTTDIQETQIDKEKVRETFRQVRMTVLHFNPKDLKEAHKQDFENNKKMIEAFEKAEKELGL